MNDLQNFTSAEMIDVGASLRKVARGAVARESAAQRIARFLYDGFVDPATQRSSFVLVRCFGTLSLGELPADLQAFARSQAMESPPTPETRCLTLLGSAGDLPAWNSRQGSQGHMAIPLVSAQVVSSLPMVSRLILSLGLDVHALVRPSPRILLARERDGFNVFHVAEAAASPYVPAQEWVRSHGVRSVVGFGFVIPPVDIFATILFARVPIERNTAELFKTLAISAKLALLPLSSAPVFDN
jgi:hypothetical protein